MEKAHALDGCKMFAHYMYGPLAWICAQRDLVLTGEALEPILNVGLFHEPETHLDAHYAPLRIVLKDRDIIGGIGGTALGTMASRRLSAQKGQLNTIFAGGIVLVALYMLYRSWIALARGG